MSWRVGAASEYLTFLLEASYFRMNEIWRCHTLHLLLEIQFRLNAHRSFSRLFVVVSCYWLWFVSFWPSEMIRISKKRSHLFKFVICFAYVQCMLNGHSMCIMNMRVSILRRYRMTFTRFTLVADRNSSVVAINRQLPITVAVRLSHCYAWTINVNKNRCFIILSISFLICLRAFLSLFVSLAFANIRELCINVKFCCTPCFIEAAIQTPIEA